MPTQGLHGVPMDSSRITGKVYIECRWTVADGLTANQWAQDIHGVLGIHELGNTYNFGN